MIKTTMIKKVRSAKNRILGWFRKFSGWCRVCGLACVTLILRTNKPLWKKVAHAGPPSWDERNAIIAGFIPAGSSVLDVGCGAQTLRQHLSSDCKYQPADIIKSSPDVIFCDINAGIYPQTDGQFDFVVCSGIFEYMRRPKEFLARIPRLGRTVIMSYNPLLEGGSKLERLGNGYGWVNHYKKDELENLFAIMELQWSILHTDKLNYIIYSLQAGGKSQNQTTN